jgi:hypothetical protein
MFVEFCWFGFTPLDSATKAAAYQETEETQGDYSAKVTRMLTKGVLLLMIMLDLAVLPELNFLTSWGWDIFPHLPHSLGLYRQTSSCSQRSKSTS